MLGPVCGEIIRRGGTVIVFDWHGSVAHPDADGFHVYVMPGHVLSTGMSSSGSGQDTVVMKRDATGPTCYVIRAYKGAVESTDSQEVCTGPGTTARTETLDPIRVGSHLMETGGTTGSMSQFGTKETDVPGTLEVGFNFYSVKDPLGDFFNNKVSRSWALFDISALHASFIFKAVLHIKVRSTDTTSDLARKSGHSEFPSTESCLTEIGDATSAWFNGGRIESSFSDGLIPSRSTSVDVDVAPIVRRWAQGEPNLGFALRGPDEDNNSFNNLKCWSTLYAPQLEVTYN